MVLRSPLDQVSVGPTVCFSLAVVYVDGTYVVGSLRHRSPLIRRRSALQCRRLASWRSAVGGLSPMPSVRTVGRFSTETTGLNWCPSVNRKFPEIRRGGSTGAPPSLWSARLSWLSLGVPSVCSALRVYDSFIWLFDCSALCVRYSFRSDAPFVWSSRPLSWLDSLGLINY